MIHAIIFDMDGVLIDSQPLHYLGDQQTLKAHGVHVPLDAMTAYAGTTNKLRFEMFKEKFHLSEPLEALICEREAMMIRLVKESDAKPTKGSADLLKSIKQAGLKTAVASSSSYPFIDAVLDKLGIRTYFDLVFSGEDVAHGKPAPDVFLETCHQLKEQPENCVVIEDSANGVLAAVRAKMTCLGYQNPTSGEQDLSKANAVIDDFRTIDADFLITLGTK